MPHESFALKVLGSNLNFDGIYLLKGRLRVRRMQALEGLEAAALRARDRWRRRRRRDARNVDAGDGTHDHRLPRTSPIYADRHGKRVIFAKKLLAGGIDQLTKWRGETRPKFTSPRLF